MDSAAKPPLVGKGGSALRCPFVSVWLQEGVKLVRKAMVALAAIGIQVALETRRGFVDECMSLLPRWMRFSRICRS